MSGNSGESASTLLSRVSELPSLVGTPEGEPVKGEYKFTDEFPMADGLPEKYGVRGIPTMMAIGKDGKILGVSHNVASLVPLIEKALQQLEFLAEATGRVHRT